MLSIEATITCSNKKEDIDLALKKLNKELLEMKKQKLYNKSYDDYIRYSYLQRLQLVGLKEQEKRRSRL